jgi:periplasmic divalent cation tolerance protein
MAEEIVILITAASSDEAAGIARTLVDEHLVACVNIVPGVRSFFFWEGGTQEAAESLLVCKSRMPVFPRITERVKALHSYTVPEIIALPVAAGLDSYLAWLRDSTKE